MRLLQQMRRWQWAVLAALAGAALYLTACGGGSSPATSQPRNSAATTLTLSTRSDAGTLTASISLTGAGRLHQLSCRVSYDPAAVRPVAATRGSLVDPRAVFFSAPDAQPALDRACVPVAFTYHPGEGIPADSGTVAQLTFAVLDAARDPQLRLIDDPQYLIARDAQRAPVEITPQVAP
jgi:hypothetical protein